MKPINVVCFYWPGERWQEEGMKYDRVPDRSFRKHLARSSPVDRKLVCKYVNNLYAGVFKWAVHPFNFICFTNDKLEVNPEIELRPFDKVTNSGVLPRMYMFSEAAGLFGSQVLCLDIDVIITGPLRDIMNYEGLFCVRQRWQNGQEHLPDGDIMSFRAGKESEKLFWTPFIEDVKGAETFTKGRERYWINKVTEGVTDTWSAETPNQVCSYKKHIRNRREEGLGEARIVSCHGYPRPHDIKDQWRIDNWN